MIKFLDIQKINNQYRNEIDEAIKNVVSSGWFILGSELENFERKFSSFCGTKYCIGVASGLDALSLILRAYKEIYSWKEGDEIIVPANTFIASVLSISNNKLKPVFVDVDESSYNIDPYKIEKAITSKTRGIIPVHLYGLVAEMDKINSLSKQYGLVTIEDSAQAHGAVLNDKRTGNLADAAAFSFYPGKNLGAMGDGGAITTNDEKIFELIRSLRNYGSKNKYYFDYKGVNSRLDEMQAAILNIKLKYLIEDNNKRKAIAQFYTNNINNELIYLPKVDNSEKHAWHLYVIRTTSRKKLQNYLQKKGVQTLVHYPIPPYKQKAYTEYNKLQFEITEKFSEQILSIPISPVLSKEEVRIVVEVLNNYNDR